MRLELSYIDDPSAMIADTIPLCIAPSQLALANIVTQFNRLLDPAIAVRAAADVVTFLGSRRAGKFHKRVNRIQAVNVVTTLLPAYPETRYADIS